MKLFSNESITVDELESIFLSPSLNFSTLTRVFHLVKKQFLLEYNDFDEFLGLTSDEHNYCFDAIYSMMEEAELPEFATATWLFYSLLKSLLSNNEDLAGSIVSSVSDARYTSNRMTTSQIIAGLETIIFF